MKCAWFVYMIAVGILVDISAAALSKPTVTYITKLIERYEAERGKHCFTICNCLPFSTLFIQVLVSLVSLLHQCLHSVL